MSRKYSKAKARRRSNALSAQEHLSKVVSDVSMPMIARYNAAKHLVKASSKHRLPLPTKQRHWICRGCKTLLIPGTNARVRIRSGQRITTCMDCGRIRRFGGGPGYHRRLKNND